MTAENDRFPVEWDESKDLVNRKKHGISFDTASLVFADPDRITIYDSVHSNGEDRYITIGRVGRILFVVFTERGDVARLISARLATKEERKVYYGKCV